jgi:transcriptional regulator with XRE-family HTH domain
MTDSLTKQVKKRRLELGLKQKDMMLRVGISRQQYQHLESKGNPRLDTLSLIAKGLNSELMLIPKEKLIEVQALLENKTPELYEHPSKKPYGKKDLPDDPWQDMLEDE